MERTIHSAVLDVTKRSTSQDILTTITGALGVKDTATLMAENCDCQGDARDSLRTDQSSEGTEEDNLSYPEETKFKHINGNVLSSE